MKYDVRIKAILTHTFAGWAPVAVHSSSLVLGGANEHRVVGMGLDKRNVSERGRLRGRRPGHSRLTLTCFFRS